MAPSNSERGSEARRALFEQINASMPQRRGRLRHARSSVKTKTHFASHVDVWDDVGGEIVEEVGESLPVYSRWLVNSKE